VRAVCTAPCNRRGIYPVTPVTLCNWRGIYPVIEMINAEMVGVLSTYVLLGVSM
jgi:hypothetical protein